MTSLKTKFATLEGIVGMLKDKGFKKVKKSENPYWEIYSGLPLDRWRSRRNSLGAFYVGKEGELIGLTPRLGSDEKYLNDTLAKILDAFEKTNKEISQYKRGNLLTGGLSAALMYTVSHSLVASAVCAAGIVGVKAAFGRYKCRQYSDELNKYMERNGVVFGDRAYTLLYETTAANK